MKKNILDNESFQRILSLTILSLAVSVDILLEHRMDAASSTFALAMASVPLPVRFSRLETIRSVTMVSAICAVLGILFEAVISLFEFGQTMSDLLRVSAISAPVLYRMASSAFSMVRSHEYMGESVQGWENAVYYANTTMAALQMTLFSILVMIAPHDVGDMLGTIVAIGTAVILYSFLMVRNVSAHDGMSAERLRTRMGVAVFRGKAVRSSINYKMMYDRIIEYMETCKPYLNPSFGLEEMAKALYTNSGYVSRVINTCVGVNFSQFVNGYRVRHAMDLYRRDNSLKVAELAQMSGFNTKVTFNMAFKIVADETPGEWCRHYLENMQKEKALSTTKERHR